MLNKLILSLVMMLLFGSLQAKDIYVHPSVHIITNNQYYFNPSNGPAVTETIEPGDRLILMGDANGNRSHVQISHTHGANDNPITITHEFGDRVVINSDNTYGLFLNNSTHIVIDGGRNNVSPTHSNYYGIQIRITQGGQSIKAENGSSFLTINRIWIDVPLHVHQGSNSPAILVKSDARCIDGQVAYSEDNFLLQKLHITNNRISNAAGEGIYVGQTGDGQSGNPCQLATQISLTFDELTGNLIELEEQTVNITVDQIKPHYLDDVIIDNNIVENVGWDAIQLSRCHNFKVSNNKIINFASKSHAPHKSGIIIGEGCSGAVNDNYLDRGYGAGIEARPSGNLWIFNNILVDCPRKENPVEAAINTYATYNDLAYVRGRNIIGEKETSVTHNLVYNAQGFGIRMNTIAPNETAADINPAVTATCIGNAIANASEPIGIQIQGNLADRNSKHLLYTRIDRANYITLDLANLKLMDTSDPVPYYWDIRPQEGSPLIDRAPLLYENTLFRDYYDQVRGPFMDIIKIGKIQGAGIGPDFGPAERILPIQEISITRLF